MSLRTLLLTGLLVLMMPWTAAVCGDNPRVGTQAADAELMSRLIRQLGSNTFEERQSATRALERIGIPALEPLRRTASSTLDWEVRRRAANLVEHIENSLDQLLADYRDYGLPLPPGKAPVVRFEERPPSQLWADGDGTVEMVTIPPTYTLGFLIEPATKDRLATLLHGTETYYRDAKQVGPVLDPQRLTVKDVEDHPPRASAALALAVQMHARGWNEAAALFENLSKLKSEHMPRKALRFLSWDYWDNRLLDQEVDSWPRACRHMKALLADEPELDTPEHRQLLKSLEAALVPSKAKPGSVAALIDDLINIRETRNIFLGSSDERYMRVLDLGFEAVPLLLKHLDDERLTRYRYRPQFISGLHTETPYHYRVRNMASDLLRDLAGQDTSAEWPQGKTDPAALKRHASAWWDAARKQGEEAYLLAHALPPVHPDEPQVDGKVRHQNRDEWPDPVHVRLLGKKYPWRLAQIYRDILETRPRMQSWPLAEAIARSSLGHREKVALFVLAAGNKILEHRRAALWQLKDLDKEQFVTLLVATLDDLSGRTTEPFWSSREAAIPILVCTTEDLRAWLALERAARRSDPGLRLEMLKVMDGSAPTPTQRRRRLTFLSAFLDDADVRDVHADKELFSGLNAGSDFPRLEVRNFAAMMIAKMVGPAADPKPDWTADQWANLREQMRTAVKRELAEDKK